MVRNTKEKSIKQKAGKKIPAISVIAPAYNTGKYIADCLDSVLPQTFQDFEIICIDDGSTDNSLAIFKQYAKKDPRIKVIAQKNMGVVSARNNAIKEAQGEYIFPLDSDDVIARNCLEVLYKFITTHDYAVVCPGGRYFGEKDLPLVLPKPTNWNMYNYNNGIHNSSLYAKKFWKKYGGYDRTFDAGTEDFDFWLNFLDDGQKVIRLDDQCLFYYRIKPTVESSNKQTSKKEGYGDVAKTIKVNMIKKHPRMKEYMRIKKRIKIPRTIARFFIRWEISKRGYFRIRIFKIPVFWFKTALAQGGM